MNNNTEKYWECDSCNYKLNWKRRGKCVKCSNKKTDTQLKGDWFCNACDDYQFSKNKECRTCRCKKNDKINTDMCVICLDAPRNCVIIHGDNGHNITCITCASKLKKCPICRQRIENVIKMFK